MNDAYRERRKVIETAIPALVAGSEVYYLGRRFDARRDKPAVRKVARVTKTHVILADREGAESTERFYRAPSGGQYPDGSRIGEAVDSDRFDRASIEPITPEFREFYEGQEARRNRERDSRRAFDIISSAFRAGSAFAFSDVSADETALLVALGAVLALPRDDRDRANALRAAGRALVAAPLEAAGTSPAELERLAAEPGYYEAGGNAEAVAFLESRGIPTERARAFVAERNGPYSGPDDVDETPEGSDR